ncbi:hypothetical protein KZZ52_31030 [Dactylosporangium sp. AC04546]|uniref:hypothetical protein n=1 Tax=Dactylosporangium sp. AC04546 TaxID=2862460 RepID=UPI001EDE8872|nr:hypothetical protein [Dactylosporangium sp. AC04546]WVK78428.1 hypothetical protein KZZ52_31030 [Dactylosporangium sp. AC04546]
MLETGGPAVSAALRAAGFDLRTDVPGCVAVVDVPGGHVAVRTARVTPDDHGWASAVLAAEGVDGFEVGFHPEAYRWPVERAYAVFVDDVVAQVADWGRWEDTWSVEPAGEPAAKRRRRLERLAASRLAGTATPVDVDLDPLLAALLDAAQAAALDAAVEALHRPGITWQFPRDRTGARLAGRARVLLHECAPPRHPAGKGIWLVVDGPAQRTAHAEPRLTVRLAEVVGKSAVHRWDRVPEFWRATGDPRPLEALWGLGGTVDASFATDVADALVDGHALDALEVCGVVVDEPTQRLLTGRPTRFTQRRWTDLWVTNALTALAGAAPWRWATALGPRQRRQRLEGLRGRVASNRSGLFLGHRAGRAVLTFDCNGSPLVTPRVLWERDPDFDLLRLGLLTRADIPLP